MLAANRVPEDGLAPDVYERLRPRLVEELREGGAEIALHPSYRAADEPGLLDDERATLEALAGPIEGVRYHYLRLDPHRNLAPLADRSRTTRLLGFADDLGFSRQRAAVPPVGPRPRPAVRPGRDPDGGDGRDPRGAALPRSTPEAASRRSTPSSTAQPSWAPPSPSSGTPSASTRLLARGWDRVYFRLIEGVKARGGVCVEAKTLAVGIADTL